MLENECKSENMPYISEVIPYSTIYANARRVWRLSAMHCWGTLGPETDLERTAAGEKPVNEYRAQDRFASGNCIGLKKRV